VEKKITSSPWSVKGIDPEARQAAKLAARKAGLTLGAWLNQTIRAAAADQLKHGFVPRPIDGAGAGDGSNGAAAGGSTGQPPAPTMQAIFESIKKLSQRIDETEEKTGQVIEPVIARIDDIAADLARVKSAPPPGGASAAQAIAPVAREVETLAQELERVRAQGARAEIQASRAVAPIAHKLEQLNSELETLRAQTTTTDVLKHIDALAGQIETLKRHRGDDAAPAIAPMERAVIRLAERLQRIEEALGEPRRKGLFGIGRSS
jgi:localization factor PodJL